MKKVLLTVSLLANVALVGALIYTNTEIQKLDDQRESLTIANDQYKRKLDGAETQEPEIGSTSDSNVSMNNDSVESIPESSTSSADNSSDSIELHNHLYHFDDFSGTIEETGEPAHMSEHFTRSSVTISDSNGTYNATLFDNNDGTAQITDLDGNILYSGSWKPTKAFEILSLKSSLQNSTRNDLVASFAQRSWNDPEIARLAQTALENASAQNISNEQWQQISNDIIKQLETMENGN
ncbi:TPA: hypothetical protein QFM66_002119 [Enterococcus faecium]